jgi:hypothetical protein
MPEEKLRAILADTLGKTVLASRISQEPQFGEVMLEAMRQAFDAGMKWQEELSSYEF